MLHAQGAAQPRDSKVLSHSSDIALTAVNPQEEASSAINHPVSNPGGPLPDHSSSSSSSAGAEQVSSWEAIDHR